jgi:hypothetical protein
MTRFGRLLPAAAALGAAIVLSLGASSATTGWSEETTTIASGVDDVLYSNSSGSGTASIVTATDETWGSAIGGTSWINTSGNAGPDSAVGLTTSYTTSFPLPPGVVASITVDLLADNAATVYLNDTQIGQQPQQPDFPNFDGTAAWSYTWTTQSDFVTDGSNTLRIDNVDFGDSNGLDFLATVTYSLPDGVSVGFTALPKTYDGTTDATVDTGSPCTLTGVDPLDTVTCVSTGATATFDTKNAGSNTLTGDGFSLDGPDAWKYFIASESGTGTISQAPLDINAVTHSRIYNGTTSSTGTPTVGADQVQTGDSVTGLSQTFDSRNVGDRILSVTATYSVNDGNGGANYAILTHTANGTISQAPLDISAVSDSRTYNGTTSSTGTPTVGTDQVQTGDSVTGLDQEFDSRNAGARTLSVTAYSVNDGNGGANYAILTHTANGTISQAPLTVTAVTNTKTADGGVSALAVPVVTAGTVFTGDNTTGSFTETYDNALAGSNKTLTPAGVVNDSNSGLNYSYTYVLNTTGRIRPGPVSSLTFTAQPIDTKFGTPIYNFCAPGGSPCVAGSSVPVTVTARDAFGNLAGPGAPGADGTNATINVRIHKDNAGGSVIGPTGGTATNAGVASFGSTLVLAGTFIGDINLFAVAVGMASANDTSADFRIVNDLAPCRGPLCKNSIGNGGNNNTLQYLYGQIRTGSSYADTTLTTQFLPAGSIDGFCGGIRAVNMPVELRAAGSDVAVTNTGYMVLIIPKNTLKASGILNRGIPSFNICLGALYLGGTQGAYGSNTATGWMAKRPSGTGLVQTTPLFEPASGYWRYWGTPANCGAAGLSGTDPCILLRTKKKADITALINQGVLSAGADANMRDSDLAIVVKKPGPWDGKGGMY